MYIIFDFVFLCYSLVYVPYLILTKRWHRSYLQRFGLFDEDVRTALAPGLNVWIHAVSVGEVQAVEGLVRAIKRERPAAGIVCTVTTKTGLELAVRQLAGLATVLPSPLDFSFTVRAFIRLIQPRVYIAAETELWPNLFYFLNKHKVPLAVINGRISDRSYGRYRLIAPFLRGTLRLVDAFAMQSDAHAQRIAALGARREVVTVTGNIKFDQSGTGTAAPDPSGRESSGGPVFLAGSTHPGEEEIVLEAFKSGQREHPSWRLVIAPRHVERSADVERLVAAGGFKPVRFSSGGLGADPSTVTVVDTIGHLRALYADAALVFVGKSLCVGGGHNIIEPAAVGKPVIIGPKVENFRDIVACFMQDGAVLQVSGAAAFAEAVHGLMADAGQRAELGNRARAVVAKNRGALERTMQVIRKWL